MNRTPGTHPPLDPPHAPHPEGRPAAWPLHRRALAVFVAPGALFRELRHRHPWFDVLLVSTLVAVLAAAFTPAEVFLEHVEDPVNRRGRPVEVTSDPAEVVRFGRYLAMLSALVGHPMLVFGVAGVLSLAFTVLGGGRATFLEHLSITAHAFLIGALGTLLVLTLAALTGSGGAWPASLSVVNPFHLWMLVVLARGVSLLETRWRWSTASVVLVGGYLLLAAGVVALEAASR